MLPTFPPDDIVCATDGSIKQQRPKRLTPLGTDCARRYACLHPGPPTPTCTYEQQAGVCYFIIPVLRMSG